MSNESATPAFRYDPRSAFVSPVDARVKVAVLDEVLDCIERMAPDADIYAELQRNRNKLAKAAQREDGKSEDSETVTLQLPHELKGALVTAPHNYADRLDRDGNRVLKRRLNQLGSALGDGETPLYQTTIERTELQLLLEAVDSQIEVGAYGTDSEDLRDVLRTHMRRTTVTDGGSHD